METKRIIKALLAAFITGTVFLVAIPLIFIRVADIIGIESFKAIPILGILIFTFGLLISAYCSLIFIRRGGGTPAPIEPPRHLVRHNIYKFGRNPMYISYLIMVLGEIFYTGSIALLIYLIFLFAGINIYVIYFEEPILEKRFGEVYKEYKNEIPRWI